MRDAFICDGIRTPIGRYGGALASVRADDLAAIPLRELLSRNPGLDPAAIDDVIFGCANQAGEDNRNVAHMATLLAGYPHTVPGTTINRLCGIGSGCHRLCRQGDQSRRCRSADCRRRGIDVACAFRDGKSQHAVPASGGTL
ncbi:acetyl-CoA acetyltransferase [Klebsiella pneumoniae]|uniref:Acetyl-CoA acetyltransferase n=1 Tax=Klebsiella pneumoniae TaxID=573 RepID=A0A378BCU1_KLEPN|nr:acetyl-CoA acetyltransferase [Klebsiella pneumoniae]